MYELISMYVTLMSTVISGILNMIWCKLNILKFLKKPIDFNKNFIDGKRVFGDNKTWKGLFGYILFNMLITVVWGNVCAFSGVEKYNYLYVNYPNIFKYNLMFGLLLGLGYSLFELPNSFFKRRLDIVSGKTAKGIKKIFFLILDQADSVIGCVLVVSIFYKMSFSFYMIYVLVGTVTHILLNMLLYCLKLRKNMF